MSKRIHLSFQNLKTKSKRPVWANKPELEIPSARSDAPHNIFQPNTARSSDDDDVDSRARLMEDFDNSLSQSINKLHSLQTQLNRQSDVEPANSYHSNSSKQSGLRTGSIDDFIQGIMDNTGAHNSTHWPSAAISPPTTDRFAKVITDQASSANNISTSSQNNMLSGGQTGKAKASLSSIENLYQNIKHKTPVNQVNSSNKGKNTWAERTNKTDPKNKNISETSNDNLSEQKVLEDCMKKLTSSAIQIQRWYRRHKKRKHAGEAAMRRLLASKKEVRQTDKLKCHI